MTTGLFEELDFDYVVAAAKRANAYMSHHNIPPTPKNFTVWFNYALGTSAGLERAIKILIDGKRKFDAVLNEELFSTFVRQAAPDQDHKNISQQLMSVMDEAKGFLTTAIADNRTQMQSLGNIADQTQQGADPRSIVKNLVDELVKAVARASELESSFVEASRELNAIRSSLEESEQRAKTDTLTGLPNRRALDDFFRSAQTIAMETGQPLSVLLLDIDHFKSINDNFGHGVGDQVLRLLASVLKERIRENDLPSRYGGEELIAVLPGAELAVCKAVAERIRRAVSEYKITRRSTGGLLPKITVSIGVAQFRPGESMAELIERCDRALYRAKHAGRNRVLTEVDSEGELVIT